jgi:putative endonuclease
VGTGHRDNADARDDADARASANSAARARARANAHARANARIGRQGEDRAAARYRAAGYAVLARNWRCAAGEIDLVCARGDTLVVCEVKARSRDAHGHPVEAVTPAKQRRLRRLAATWLRGQAARWAIVRFDVVSVLDGAVEVVEDAF